jgi:hypothetical protein
VNWRKLFASHQKPFFVEEQPDPPHEPRKVYDQEQDQEPLPDPTPDDAPQREP